MALFGMSRPLSCGTRSVAAASRACAPRPCQHRLKGCTAAMATAAVAGAVESSPSLPPELLIDLPPDCRVRTRHGCSLGPSFCTNHNTNNML